MTKKEKDLIEFLSRTEKWGIVPEDALALRVAARGLRCWAERECNGEVVEEDSGMCWGYNTITGHRWRITNQRRRWYKAIDAIMEKYPPYKWYHQEDPRGCPVYIYKRDEKDINSYYNSRGLAIC